MKKKQEYAFGLTKEELKKVFRKTIRLANADQLKIFNKK